jgi:hypothetical protein
MDEFKTADGEALAINVPVGETRVLKHFQERMPYGLFVQEVSCGTCDAPRRLTRFSMGSQKPRPSYSLSKALGRGSLTPARQRAGWNIRFYAGVTPPRRDL